jgi:hypothetical protein
MSTIVSRTVGPGGDYTTLSAFEAGEQRDLVTLNEVSQARCLNFADTSLCTWAGWATDATRHILVEAANDHGGAWNTSSYRRTGTSITAIESVGEDALVIRWRGIQWQNSNAGGNSGYFYTCLNVTNRLNLDLEIDRCIFRRDSAFTDVNTSSTALRLDLVGLSEVKVSNCLFTGPSNQQVGITRHTAASGTYRLYNLTMAGAHGWSIRSAVGGGGTIGLLDIRNCVALGPAINGHFQNSSSVATLVFSHNAATDATATAVDPVTSLQLTEAEMAFEDSANGYFALTPGSLLVNAGADLSAFVPTTDIVGTSRGATWDIGAFEYSSGDPPPATRTVRVTATAYSDPEDDPGERMWRVYEEGTSTVVETTGWVTPATTQDFVLGYGDYEFTVQDRDTGAESGESTRYTFTVGEDTGDATATATGVAATAAAGSVAATGAAAATATGVQATAAAGAVTATGAVTIGANATIVGVQATAAAGTATATGTASASVAGVAASAAAGSVTATGTSSASVVGVQATAAAGTVTATGATTISANATVTGVVATAAAGTATATGTATRAITGVQATAAAGSVGATGAVTISATANVTGVQSTAAAGTVTAAGTAVIAGNATATGVQANAAAGTVTAAGTATRAIVGVSATAAAGSVGATAGTVISATATIAGVQATAAAGTATATGTANRTVTGVAANAAAGTVTAQGTSIIHATTAVVGVSATAQAGTVGATAQTVINATATVGGVQVSAAAGNTTATGSAAALPVGVTATARAGTITIVGHATTAVAGVQATAFAGDVGTYIGEMRRLQMVELEATLARRVEMSATLARQMETETRLQRAVQLTTTV